jgi:polysaccharide export outer membrane protein
LAGRDGQISIDGEAAFMQRLGGCQDRRLAATIKQIEQRFAGMRHSMKLLRFISVILSGLAVILATGCQTEAPPVSAEIMAQAAAKYDSIVLREGDVLKISFPGAPSLDVTAIQIRRDGKINLTQVGEITAAGKTPGELEKELLKLYESQLVVKQVSVSLGSSAYPVFVIGAVLRPGKVMADRPMSAFEAVMEAGGFDFARANTKAVSVLREGSDGKVTTFKLNMRATLDGRPSPPFYVKPSDVIYVREKFSWF